jgi:transposase
MKIFVNQREAARILDVSPVTIWRWVDKKKLAPAAHVMTKDGLAPVFDKERIEAMAEERKVSKSA